MIKSLEWLQIASTDDLLTQLSLEALLATADSQRPDQHCLHHYLHHHLHLHQLQLLNQDYLHHQHHRRPVSNVAAYLCHRVHIAGYFSEGESILSLWFMQT